MSLDQLERSIQADPRKAIAGAAAVAGVVIFALYHRKQAAAATSSAGTVSLPTAGLSGTPNTSATDQGNDFQNQLNGLQNQISGLTPTAGSSSNAPVYKKFVDYGNGLGVYQIENGVAKLLTLKEWVALGRPAFQSVTTTDSDFGLVTKATGTTSKALTQAAPAPVVSSAPVSSHAPAASNPGPAAEYVVPQGGTLLGAAQHFYGPAAAPGMAQALAAHNGIKLSVRGGQTVAQVYPGQAIKKP